MTGYQVYSFILSLIVFVTLTALFSLFVVIMVKQWLKLIKTGAEDEKDLSKISCDMNLFDVYTKGFLDGCGGRLTEKEIELLPMGAKIMTFECGMRFLTDYLQGDVYFKIHRPEHNLDRTRTQFKLVADMEAKWNVMTSIVAKYK